MRSIVTGGAGFIGSHLCDQLLDMGTVVCLDNFDPYYDPQVKRKNIEPFMDNPDFELVEGNILDKQLLCELFEDVDYVFHNAAQAGVRISVDNPSKSHTANATGTLNVLEAAVNSGVHKVINASSSSVYGKVSYLPFDEIHPNVPVSPYGASKLIAEHYCRVFNELHDLDTIALRYFTVFGPRMRPDLAINIFTKKALKNETIEIFGDGNKTRDFTFIDNIVDANIRAMKNGIGEYNIGGGERISIRELAEKIVSITDSESEIIYGESVKGDAEHTWSDVSKASRDLGYSPKIGLEEGLKRYVQWYIESTDQ
ncbi:SDR family oxidoreductase [Methanococcoides seepicolus]|uniref:SDR family oxidoreductase n=1 Tax=Methanococcoides seepicolus TaxID=2828780 RepID=A0A9E4ZHB6_9EURY|nr:SDR family oxidoreductase [Methanococcoides seepicolus]MCM1987209.1 SDR family oxidoreductase [Methanococcoides seepicolus]